MPTIDDIISDFELLTDWEDRYRHVIEMGKLLEPLSPEEHNEATKVRGCASQVWLVSEAQDGPNPRLKFRGDSDAHIVRGLIAIVIALYSDKSAKDILKIDAKKILSDLGLDTHLSPQRSNGLASMVDRIRATAALHAQKI